MTATVGEAGFWILTSLAQGRLHGYAIMRAVAAASDSRVSLKATTLYATLERLESAELIASDGDDIVDGRARRYFRLTDDGRSRLEEELRDIEARARAARSALAKTRVAPAHFRPAAAS